MKNIYPRLCRVAYRYGEKARKDGLPKCCNLKKKSFVTPSGNILKVYQEMWNLGWENVSDKD